MGETNKPDDHSFGQTFQTKLVEPTSVVYQLINPLKQCFGRSDVAHKVLMTLATTRRSWGSMKLTSTPIKNKRVIMAASFKNLDEGMRLVLNSAIAFPRWYNTSLAGKVSCL
jgi:hypothetical protein